MKIVLDTNIWISYFIGKSLRGFTDKILSRRILILTSDEQLHEMEDVLSRQKFRKYFDDADIKEMLFLISKLSKTIKIREKVNDCRDRKDNFILDIAVNGKAEILVTGDSDLLVLHPYRDMQIITTNAMNRLLNAI